MDGEWKDRFFRILCFASLGEWRGMMHGLFSTECMTTEYVRGEMFVVKGIQQDFKVIICYSINSTILKINPVFQISEKFSFLD